MTHLDLALQRAQLASMIREGRQLAQDLAKVREAIDNARQAEQQRATRTLAERLRGLLTRALA